MDCYPYSQRGYTRTRVCGVKKVRIEKEKNAILSALRIAHDDLLVQRGDTLKYAPQEDVDLIVGEIDNHLNIIETAQGYIHEWAEKLGGKQDV